MKDMQTVARARCPQCGKTKHLRKRRRLYGVPICRRCRNGLANRRQVAFVLDWIIAWGVFTILEAMLWQSLLHIRWFYLQVIQMHPSTVVLLALLWNWLVIPMIFFCKDGFRGQSLGKLICGVKVVHRESFKSIGFLASFKRNLPILIPFMPVVIAFQLQKGYRLGDGWAHTKVVRKRLADHPLFTGLLVCDSCQYDLTGNTTGVCPECGSALSAMSQHRLAEQTAPHGEGMPKSKGHGGRYAISSLVLGLVGIPLFSVVGLVGGVAGLFAIIMGYRAMDEMSRCQNSDGKVMAVIGIVLGLIEFGFVVASGILMSMLMPDRPYPIY